MKKLLILIAALAAFHARAENIATGTQAPTTLHSGAGTGKALSSNADFEACKADAAKRAVGKYRCKTDSPIEVAAKVVVPPAPTPLPTDGYTKCADEYATCALKASSAVIYGADQRFTAPKVFAASTACTNAVFGDPAPGAVKACWFKAQATVPVPPTLPTPAPPITTPPPTTVGGFDPATGLPRVDRSKIPQPDPAKQYSTERVKKLDLNPDGTVANPNVFYSYVTGDIGAFREACDFAGMNFDDSLVYPGQVGGSPHLHTYFGVFANANTTSANIRSAKTSSCAGGTLNNTAYWMPSMIDTLDGKPIAPVWNNAYYKGSYYFPATASKNIVPVPVGLHLIAGDAGNTDPAKGRGLFVCLGPKGENPGWKGTISAAYADGTCLPGGELVMEFAFPICWDGVNLDSPDHKSHVVDPKQVQTGSTPQGNGVFEWQCPSTHPKQLPTISYNIHYAIPDAKAVSRWYLSSDRNPAAPGSSAHADYLMGWKPETVETFTKHCLNEQRDCHNYLLGDNVNMLY